LRKRARPDLLMPLRSKGLLGGSMLIIGYGVQPQKATEASFSPCP
jgi:hypothetical protein